jgi:hypothetical protein
VVCVVAYLLTGNRSIYPAQRLLRSKGGAPHGRVVALRDLTDAPPAPVPPPSTVKPPD